MSRHPRQHGRRSLLVVSIGLFISLSGCTHPPEPARVRPTPDPVVQRDTPIDAARATLTLLQQHLAAVSAGDEARANERLEQVVWHLVAHEQIIRRFRGNRMADRKKSDVDVLSTLVESWAALLANYADELQLDAMTVVQEGVNGAAVRCPIADANDDTAIMLALVPTDNEWYVLAIDFGTAAAPTTQPTADE